MGNESLPEATQLHAARLDRLCQRLRHVLSSRAIAVSVAALELTSFPGLVGAEMSAPEKVAWECPEFDSQCTSNPGGEEAAQTVVNEDDLAEATVTILPSPTTTLFLPPPLVDVMPTTTTTSILPTTTTVLPLPTIPPEDDPAASMGCDTVVAKGAEIVPLPPGVPYNCRGPNGRYDAQAIFSYTHGYQDIVVGYGENGTAILEREVTTQLNGQHTEVYYKDPDDTDREFICMIAHENVHHWQIYLRLVDKLGGPISTTGILWSDMPVPQGFLGAEWSDAEWLADSVINLLGCPMPTASTQGATIMCHLLEQGGVHICPA